MESIEVANGCVFFIGHEVVPFEKIYGMYKEGLQSAGMRITGDRETANEIVDFLLIDVCRRNDVFASIVELKAYLYRACKNRSIDYLRSMKRRSVRIEDLEGHADLSVSSVEDEIVSVETLKGMVREVGCLPKRMRTILVLSYVNRYSAVEIARLMEVSENSVYNKRSQALKRLRLNLVVNNVI